MGNYSGYYKDIENSIPMKSVDNLTKQRQEYFSKFMRKSKSICEYGCGPGTNVKYLLQYCDSLNCFDIEEALRPYVISRADKNIVEYNLLIEREGGITTGKPDNTYDIIYSTDVLEHIYWPRMTVKEMYRILKNGGQAFITVPYHGLIKNLAIAFLSFDRHYSPDDPHVRFFTRKTLIDVFVSEGFTVDHIGYLGRVRGLSKNICAIFRKN